eukprot:3019889-Prymnesium_polylepis.1
MRGSSHATCAAAGVVIRRVLEVWRGLWFATGLLARSRILRARASAAGHGAHIVDDAAEAALHDPILRRVSERARPLLAVGEHGREGERPSARAGASACRTDARHRHLGVQ